MENSRKYFSQKVCIVSLGKTFIEEKSSTDIGIFKNQNIYL